MAAKKALNIEYNSFEMTINSNTITARKKICLILLGCI
jgi:hypothetical protein